MTHAQNNFQFRNILLCFFLFTLVLTSACSKNDGDESGNNSRHLANSKNYLEQGQYRAAILEARNAISKSPSADASIHLARLYMDLGQPRSAITLLEASEPKTDALLLKLAEAYVEAQKFSSASKALEQVSESARASVDYHLVSGLTAAGMNKLDMAETHFDAVLALEPAHERALMSKLIVALAHNDNVGVDALSTQLQTEHSASPESLLLLAKLEYKKQNYPAAEELLMTAIHNSRQTDVMLPVKASVLQLLIETLTQQGRFADAVPFNKVLSEANPGWQESQEALKNIVQQIQLGNWQEAETLLKQFKENYPDSNAADSLLGLVSLQKGNFEDADAILENAVDPETASPIMIGASVLSKLRNNEKLEAYAILKESLSTKPDNTRLLSMYGALALELEGEEAEGEKSLLKVLELDPGDARVYGLLASYYFRENQKAKAKAILLKAHEFNPQMDQIQYAIVRSFVSNDMAADALGFVQKLQKDAANASSTWVASALHSIHKQNYQQAQSELTKALQLDDKNYPAWALSAASYLKLDNRKAALDTLEKALKKFPDNRTLLVQSAQLYLAENNAGKAQEKASELERIGETALANFIRADVLHNEGKTEEAYQLLLSEWNNKPSHRLGVTIMRYASKINKTIPDSFLQTWEQIAPNNPQAHLAIGNVHLNQGNIDKALVSFETVLSLDANNVVALNNAAWFLQEKGESARALELAAKAAELAPKNAAVLDTYGWIKFQNNDASSVDILKKALDLAPNAQDIQQHYAEAKAKYR